MINYLKDYAKEGKTYSRGMEGSAFHETNTE